MSKIDHGRHTATGRSTRTDLPVIRRLVDAGVQLDVGMRIDEAGQDHAAFGIDDAANALGRQIRPDSDDLITGHQQIRLRLPGRRNQSPPRIRIDSAMTFPLAPNGDERLYQPGQHTAPWTLQKDIGDRGYLVAVRD